jgi:DNA-binding response OmpR family regulator
MPIALLCSTVERDTLTAELAETLVFREDITRSFASTVGDVDQAIALEKPDLIIVDRDFEDAVALVLKLRGSPETRRVSIVALARSDFGPIEVALLDAGVNAVLRLPATAEWDERLARLIAVPVRREVRLPIALELEASLGVGVHSTVALALNMSVSGMLIETDRELTIGDDVDLRFRLPHGEGDIAGCARVVRHAGPRRYGIEFYGLEADGADLVRHYLERLDDAVGPL